MERGGGILHSSLRMHYTSIISCSSLFSPSPSNPLLRSAINTRRLLRTAPLAAGARNLFPARRSRSCICSKEDGYHILQKVIYRSEAALRAFSSCGSQESKLDNEKISKDKFLIDCETDQECVVGGIVALGKFDALHTGHRELAIQASKVGIPFLLSFAGMAEVLGWECRPPIVAKCDRKRVLSSWAPFCGNVVPLEFQVEFSTVRHLTPRQFVEKLSKELGVSGVVAGENYRFGYKASGDAQELVRLCKEYGVDAYIVSPVMDKTQRSYNGAASKGINSSEKGQVSSTRVRAALAMGDMEHVTHLLGRKHRLVLMATKECLYTPNMITVPRSCMLNQPPKDGEFNSCTLLLDNAFVGPCRIIISAENISIELESDNLQLQNPIRDGQLIGIEFG